MERRARKFAGGAGIAVLALVATGCAGTDEVAAPPAAAAPSSSATGVVEPDGSSGGAGQPGEGETPTSGKAGRNGPSSDEGDPAPGEAPATALGGEAPTPASVPSPEAAAGGKVLSATMGRAVITDRGRRITVLWGPSTQIVRLGDLDPSKIRVGACVLALPPSDTNETGTAFEAALVRLLAPSGRCRSTVDRRSADDGNDSGGSDQSFEGYSVQGGGVIGAVTEASTGALLIRPASGARTQTYTVSTTPDTRFTRTGAGDPSGRGHVTAGSCVTAYGTASSAGDVIQADRIRVTAAVRGRCPSGAPTSDRD